MMDLRRLRVLRTVVRSGSMAAAARELGYTPSAISQHLAVLEREAGSVLLEKAGRGVRPTPAARLLADVADDVLGRLEDAEAALAALREGRTGRLSLTSFPSAGASLVPPAVAAFRRSHPEVELVLGVAVVVPPAQVADDVLVVHLLDDPYSVLLPADHRLAGVAAVDLADLADDPWVGTTSAPGHCQQAALDACAAAGFAPVYTVHGDEYPTTSGFVAAGLGVALVPALALSGTAGVVVRPVRGLRPARRVCAAVRRARADEVVVRAAVSALQDAARSLAADGRAG